MHRGLMGVALAFALALGWLTVDGHAQVASAADETPDLVVEVVQAGGQSAELKVTNKSSNWADQTTMTVLAQGQEQIGASIQPNVISQQFPIENLDPGQSTTVLYVLPVPCLLHVLTVAVIPAGNYEGAKESNTSNNAITVPLCAPTSAAAPSPDDLLQFGGCACDSNKPSGNVEKAVSVRTWMSARWQHNTLREVISPPSIQTAPSDGSRRMEYQHSQSRHCVQQRVPGLARE